MSCSTPHLAQAFLSRLQEENKYGGSRKIGDYSHLILKNSPEAKAIYRHVKKNPHKYRGRMGSVAVATERGGKMVMHRPEGWRVRKDDKPKMWTIPKRATQESVLEQALTKAELRFYHGERGRKVARSDRSYQEYLSSYKRLRRRDALIRGATTAVGTIGGVIGATTLPKPTINRLLVGGAVGAGFGAWAGKRSDHLVHQDALRDAEDRKYINNTVRGMKKKSRTEGAYSSRGGLIDLLTEADRWMQNAVKRPGAFKAKAQKAGMSTAEFAARVLTDTSKYDDRTVKQANLAKTFAKFRKKNVDESVSLASREELKKRVGRYELKMARAKERGDTSMYRVLKNIDDSRKGRSKVLRAYREKHVNQAIRPMTKYQYKINSQIARANRAVDDAEAFGSAVSRQTGIAYPQWDDEHIYGQDANGNMRVFKVKWA